MRLTTQKTSFTAGEVAPRLTGRGDLRAYENGASKLRNVFVHATGGISRRPGLRYVDTARGKGRLVSFEFNTEQVYLLVFTEQKIDVYKDDINIVSIDTPWTANQIKLLSWVQSADTLIVVHGETTPKKITRTTEENWTIEDWSFVEKDGRIFQPTHKFAGEEVTLTPSGTSGSITLTASADVFIAAHVGTRFRISNKEVEITGVTNATQAQATTKQTLSSTAAQKDWEEQAFSGVRGWPVSLCFHQDRMVIGGSRDLPNRLWLSKSSDLFNFDLGEGLDDESIEFAILSDQVNAVRAVFSGRHLQIFTSGAEWMATGDPLTPSSIQLNRQTRIGSPIDRWVPPRDVDGATLFIPRNGPELREFLFADVEQAYQSTDLAKIAYHMVDAPQDQDYDTTTRLLHIVMANGILCSVTMFRSEQITAWTAQETNGLFVSVSVIGTHTYVLVNRQGTYLIERFDEELQLDAALTDMDETGKTQWTVLDDLEGMEVAILADGAPVENQIVVDGAVTLDNKANRIEVGLAYAHLVVPLPPFVQTGQGGNQGGKLRPVSMTFRLMGTAALVLDTGKGLQEVPFKTFGSALLDKAPQLFSGDKTVRALGWKSDGSLSIWRIEQDLPLPFILLSVATEISVNG